MITNTKYNIVKTVQLMLLSATFVVFFGVGTASAQSPSVTLSVNGGSSANVAAGSSVTLNWQAVGVSNCSINNGVGAVANSGSRQVVVPQNGATYVITCSGQTDSVVLNVSPGITMSLQPYTVTAAQNGPGTIRIHYSAVNASHCNLLTARGMSSGQTRTLFSTNQPVSSTYNDTVTERTEYSLRCVNAQTNRSTTKVVQMTAFVPYGPPEISSFTVSRSAGQDGVYDPNWVGALVDAKYTASNVSFCARTATRSGGQAIDVPGWTGASGTFGTNGNNLFTFPIGETLNFKIRCNKGSTYVERNATFVVPPPDAGVQSQAPSASLTVPEPPVVTVVSPSNLPVSVGVKTESANVNRCTFTAFRAGTNTPISIPGWTDRVGDWWRLEGEFNISMRESARLVFTCTRTSDNATATDTDTMTIQVNDTATPTVNFTGQITGVTNNTSDLQLNWSSQNVNYCNATNVIRNGSVVDNWYRFGTVPLGGTRTVNVYGSGEYSITCGNSATGMSATEIVTVSIDDTGGAFVVENSVVVNVPPTVNLEVDEDNPMPGDNVTLTWESENADTCTGTGFDTSGQVDNSTGVQVAVPSNAGVVTYVISCTGPGGTRTDEVDITVGIPANTVTLSAEPNVVRKGDDTTLTWTAHQAYTCTLTNGGVNVAGFNPASATPDANGVRRANLPQTGLTAERTYTLNCTSGTQSESAQATVRVIPLVQES